ncbi:MAG: porin [Sterolibacterium sp.]|nr:porin [Sterolibacterium sp.]
MQKKLIAMAVAGLVSGAAFAQSNVVLYGVADASFDVVRVSGDNAAAKTGAFTRVSTNSSYLGFKGTEDLGSGLKAVFQFEGGVSFDTGGGLSTGRDSFVGLNGGFGTVVLGNLTGPTRALDGAVDVNVGNTGIGSSAALVGKLGNNLVGGFNSTAATAATVAPATACGRSATCTSPFDTRFNNAIAYVSPSLSGLTLTAAYVANENKTTDVTPVGGVQLNSKGYDLGGKYENGPIMVGLTFAEAKLGDAADTKASDVRFGGSYSFGAASVRALWDSVKLEANAAAEKKQDVWGLGATYNVTPEAKLTAQYYTARDLKIGGASQTETGANLLSLGVEYNLSKRTMLKAVFARLENDKNAKYDYGLNAVGHNAADTTLNGLQVGVRHSF